MSQLTPLQILLSQIDKTKIETKQDVVQYIEALLPLEEEHLKTAYRTGHNDYANFDYYASSPDDFYNKKYKE